MSLLEFDNAIILRVEPPLDAKPLEFTNQASSGKDQYFTFFNFGNDTNLKTIAEKSFNSSSWSLTSLNLSLEFSKRLFLICSLLSFTHDLRFCSYMGENYDTTLPLGLVLKMSQWLPLFFIVSLISRASSASRRKNFFKQEYMKWQERLLWDLFRLERSSITFHRLYLGTLPLLLYIFTYVLAESLRSW